MKVVLLVAVLALLAVVPYVLALHPQQSSQLPTAPQFTVIGSGATWSSGRWWPFWISGPFVKLDMYTGVCALEVLTADGSVWSCPVEFAWSELDYVERRPTGLKLVRANDQKRSILFNGHRDELIGQLSKFPVAFR